jgi:hypothetical protein
MIYQNHSLVTTRDFQLDIIVQNITHDSTELHCIILLRNLRQKHVEVAKGVEKYAPGAKSKYCRV